MMVKGTRGYPFLSSSSVAGMASSKSEPEISMQSAQEGVSNALRRLGRLI